MEDYPLPLKRYLLLFMAILGVRLCLEFFANQRLFRLEDVLHIGLWFIFIVEAFMLQLHLFSRVRVELIVKLVVCCFSIALTAPIIDLIVSQGKFSKMNYLTINTPADLIWSYLTIGGASLSRGATIGIRIEIVLLVIASFNYVYLKTGNIFRSLLGTLSIYTVLFFSGTLPFLIGKLNDLLHLTYGPDDQSSVYLLFTLDMVLFLILAYRFRPKSIPVKVSPRLVFRIISALGLVVLGAYLARKQYPDNWHIDPTTIYYFPLLAIVLLLLFAFENYAINSRGQSPDNFHVSNGLLAVTVLTAACISFYTCFSVLMAWSVLFLLYEKPLTFVHIPVLSAILQSCLNCAFLFIGFMTFRAPMIGMGKNVLFLTLALSFSFHLILSFLNRYIRKNNPLR